MSNRFRRARLFAILFREKRFSRPSRYTLKQLNAHLFSLCFISPCSGAKGVRNFGRKGRTMRACVYRVSGRSACGRFNSFKIICFLPDPFSTPAPLLVRATFSENYALPCPRGLMQHHRGGKGEIRSIFFAPPLSTGNYSAW